MERKSSDALEVSIVDATERCFERLGVAKTSMSDVAAEAGVSRTTLYKRFSKIEDVLQAVFVREFDRFERRLGRRLGALPDPADRLVEVVVATAENVPENAGIARLAQGPRTRSEARALAVGRSALNERVEALIGEPLDGLEAEGRLRADVGRAELIEWIRRVVLALAVAPQPRARSAADRRASVAAFLIPSVCPTAPEGAVRTQRRSA